VLRRVGWDVDQYGMRAAPEIQLIVGEEAHSSIFRVLSLLGFGRANGRGLGARRRRIRTVGAGVAQACIIGRRRRGRRLLGDRRRHGNQLSLHCCGSAKKEVMKKRSWFTRFAKTTAHVTGRPRVFALAAGTVAAWLISGPIFGFSDTWQLYINTGTTIVTFLMVFLIQNTQNRDTAAIQIKLDELIRVTKGHNALMDLEELEEQDLEAFRARYEKMAAVARRKISRGGVDIDSPEP
jgi:low affinity Fe/Cu permease